MREALAFHVADYRFDGFLPGDAMELIDRMRGALFGLAVGDAVGTSVEFQPRGSFPPVTDMTGGGPFKLKAGEWTDDTSMALCLAVSLIQCNGFDAGDQMDRYCRWMDEGYLSSNGSCFDVGNTVRAALARYRKTKDPFAGSTDTDTAGNGSIMRLAPIAMFFYPDHDAAIRWAAESSRTTHGTAECLDACRLLAAMLCRAFDGAPKADVLAAGANLPIDSPKIAQIARGEYRSKSSREIRGTAYVVNSLEAALWCFDTSDNFEATVLKAVNLGDDADTTGAVSGQIAGAFYGSQVIPATWVAQLALRPDIETLAQLIHDWATSRA